QSLGLEGALSAGDEQRPGAEGAPRTVQPQGAALLGHDVAHLFVEDHVGLELHRLLNQVLRQILGEYLGKSAHVEDVLLRIQGGELSAELGKRVDDSTGDAPHAGVERAEQPGGTSPYDRD